MSTKRECKLFDLYQSKMNMSFETATMQKIVFLLLILLAQISQLTPAFSGEVVEQPCLNYCPDAMWSAPLYASVMMPATSDPVKIKYRSRYNTCLDYYDVFIDWIASTGSSSEQALATLWASSANDLVMDVGLQLLLENPMGFPPTTNQNSPSIVKYSIVAGICFEKREQANCPTQYVSNCQADFCGYSWYDVGLNMLPEREYVIHEPVFTIIESTCPEITTEPSDIATCVGSNSILSVVSTSPHPASLEYQWQIRESEWLSIDGANTSSLALNNISADMHGTAYRVVVKDRCGQTVSDDIELTIIDAPSIVTQPADFVTVAGSVARFQVVLSVPADASYQWQVNAGSGWADISGATDSELNLPSLTLVDDGNKYRVEITNSCALLLSAEALLTVD